MSSNRRIILIEKNRLNIQCCPEYKSLNFVSIVNSIISPLSFRLAVQIWLILIYYINIWIGLNIMESHTFLEGSFQKYNGNRSWWNSILSRIQICGQYCVQSIVFELCVNLKNLSPDSFLRNRGNSKGASLIPGCVAESHQCHSIGPGISSGLWYVHIALLLSSPNSRFGLMIMLIRESICMSCLLYFTTVLILIHYADRRFSVQSDVRGFLKFDVIFLMAHSPMPQALAYQQI